MTDATAEKKETAAEKKARLAEQTGQVVPEGARYTVTRQETRNGTDTGPAKVYEAGEELDLKVDIGQQLVIRADAAPKD